MKVPLLALAILASFATAASADPKGIEFFEKDVRPLLAGRCYQCHAAGTKAAGGLLLDSKPGWSKGGDSGPVIKPGDASSLLLRAISYTDDDLKMPPTGKLSADEIAVLAKWVAMGAPDPRTDKPTGKEGIDLVRGRLHWAYQLPKKHPAPEVRDAAWPRTEIDCFLRAKQEAAGLQPVADADRHALMRRVTFDLTGLPPSVDDIEAFLADDSPTAFEKVVDRLLATPHFGERWGRHWLDLARYSDTSGAANNQFLIDAWRYRDYVIDAFNRDLPFDHFVAEQLAGDLMKASNPAEKDRLTIATGFLALGPYDAEKMTADVRMNQIDEQIDVSTKTFLATTVSCARCHDHKYDPIPTRDYHALAGIFGSTEILKTAVYTKGKHTFVRLGVGAEVQGFQAKPFAAFEKTLEDLYGGRQTVVRMGWAKNTALREAAASKNAKEKAALEAKAASIQKEMDARTARSKAAEQALRTKPVLPPTALGVRDGKPHDQAILVRGEVENKGPVVPRGFVQVLTHGKSPAIPRNSSGRLQLAKWMASKSNPLTARVMVNRVWQHLFGAGLVTSVDNFGITGERPSHPELLDTLAVQFMDDGWSVKRMIRRIVLSRSYQLGSTRDAKGDEIDADNRLLWRANRKRLEAEPIRDSILAFSGVLDRTPLARSQVADHGIGTMRFDADSLSFDTPKRALYLPQTREGRKSEIIALFDGPDTMVVVGEREVTTVPPQALFLLNNPFVLDQAKKAAERLESQGYKDESAKLDFAIRLAFGRPATERDQAAAKQFFAAYHSAAAEDRSPAAAPAPQTKAQKKLASRQALAAKPSVSAWTAYCQMLMASPEFISLN